jgi:hypothetical protein
MLSTNGLSSGFHGDLFSGSDGSSSLGGGAARLSISVKSALMLAWSFCNLGLAMLDEVVDPRWENFECDLDEYGNIQVLMWEKVDVHK